jgi:hypothetical protein
MKREQIDRKRAMEAARELVEHLDVPADERPLVLVMAVDRLESVRATLRSIGASKACLSAVFAAALEYSETLADSQRE